ncbi:MAG: hypothetical protein Q7S56_00120 [Nanoarchaeota archaeon]|nr:hypothetical protein [Nanoarchaeota archaeon]
MGYKNNSRAVEGCSMDFGRGKSCVFYGKECGYRGRIKKCPHYREYFMSEEEKEKAQVRGLKKIVKEFGLNGK